MKKTYNSPIAQVSELIAQDVITSSGFDVIDNPTNEKDLDANHDNNSLAGMLWN